MDYIRKRHWVTYTSSKCKMYLRNDFRFECAYCGAREQDNGMKEHCFEKDHFIPKHSKNHKNTDNYENMVYACRTCNKTKSDQQISLILDPTKDNIYSGLNPHIRKLGRDKQFRLEPLTQEGQQFIDNLQLNSRFHRQARQMQWENAQRREIMRNLLNSVSDKWNEDDVKKIRKYLDTQMENLEKQDEFRCGYSKAGEQLLRVLHKFQEIGVWYELIFADDDLDIKLEFEGNIYYCEITTSKSIKSQGRKPIISKEKQLAWLETGKRCCVLCYYEGTDRCMLWELEAENDWKRYEL